MRGLVAGNELNAAANMSKEQTPNTLKAFDVVMPSLWARAQIESFSVSIRDGAKKRAACLSVWTTRRVHFDWAAHSWDHLRLLVEQSDRPSAPCCHLPVGRMPSAAAAAARPASPASHGTETAPAAPDAGRSPRTPEPSPDWSALVGVGIPHSDRAGGLARRRDKVPRSNVCSGLARMRCRHRHRLTPDAKVLPIAEGSIRHGAAAPAVRRGRARPAPAPSSSAAPAERRSRARPGAGVIDRRPGCPGPRLDSLCLDPVHRHLLSKCPGVSCVRCA
jgi:hypothetical protein